MRPELTILMPCLNEARTLTGCIAKAQRFLEQYGISGEVLVADNGSTDGSIELATGLNARVVAVPVRGYGAALAAGIAAAKGEYVIMGDSDESYDFSALAPFVAKLRDGYDLVMGNRLSRRDCARRHAAHASLFRQSFSDRPWPSIFLLQGYWRFLLRASWFSERSDPRTGAAKSWNGVCPRDGDQGGDARSSHHRGADDAIA